MVFAAGRYLRTDINDRQAYIATSLKTTPAATTLASTTLKAAANPIRGRFAGLGSSCLVSLVHCSGGQAGSRAIPCMWCGGVVGSPRIVVVWAAGTGLLESHELELVSTAMVCRLLLRLLPVVFSAGLNKKGYLRGPICR